MELSSEQVAEITSKLSAQLAAATAQAAPPGQPAGFAPVGVGVQPMAAGPSLLLLRIKVPCQGGEAGGYLAFPLPEGATAQTVQDLTQQAERSWPIETFRPRENRGWGGENKGGYGRGYRNNRRW